MNARGFTLIEMLVALAILAVALAATQRALAVAIDNASELKLRLFAGWVAENRLAELRAAGQPPVVGERSGEAEQAGLRFRWTEQVSQTFNQDFRRVEIRVLPVGGDDHAKATLVGYLTTQADAR